MDFSPRDHTVDIVSGFIFGFIAAAGGGASLVALSKRHVNPLWHMNASVGAAGFSIGLFALGAILYDHNKYLIRAREDYNKRYREAWSSR